MEALPNNTTTSSSSSNGNSSSTLEFRVPPPRKLPAQACASKHYITGCTTTTHRHCLLIISVWEVAESTDREGDNRERQPPRAQQQLVKRCSWSCWSGDDQQLALCSARSALALQHSTQRVVPLMEEEQASTRRPGKVPLAPGYSQMRWMQLSRTEDLSGAH